MGSSASRAGAQRGLPRGGEWPSSLARKGSPTPSGAQPIVRPQVELHLLGVEGGGSPTSPFTEPSPTSFSTRAPPPHLCNSLLSSSSASKWENPKAR